MTREGVLHGLGIVGLCVGAAIVYGIAHDLVTAHLSVEYFTVGHPKVIESESPILLALTWGVLATWWFGLGLGVPLAILARIGPRPAFTAGDLVVPVARVMVAIGATAILFGLAGWSAADLAIYLDPGAVFDRIPPERRVPYVIAQAAHQGAYAGGASYAIALWFWVGGARRRRERGLVAPPV